MQVSHAHWLLSPKGLAELSEHSAVTGVSGLLCRSKMLVLHWSHWALEIAPRACPSRAGALEMVAGVAPVSSERSKVPFGLVPVLPERSRKMICFAVIARKSCGEGERGGGCLVQGAGCMSCNAY